MKALKRLNRGRKFDPVALVILAGCVWLSGCAPPKQIAQPDAAGALVENGASQPGEHYGPSRCAES